MATRAQALVPIAIAAAIVGVAGIISIPEDSKLESVDFPRGTIVLDGKFLEVQIADTEPRRVRGLMFQEGLGYDEGMIFEFDKSGTHSLWMLNMQFPLDMIWFDKNGTIVHVEEGVQPCSTALETRTCTVVNNPDSPAKYVLELAAGYVQMFQVNEDSVLEIISI